jgi:hypothetical protein
LFAARDATVRANRNGHYVLWFEADLYDQLQIVEILSYLPNWTCRLRASG